MNDLIAAGFQNTVDFELEWRPDILRKLLQAEGIGREDIRQVHPISSLRELLGTLLYHMQHGSGCECLATSSELTRRFASFFPYRITLGGTAVRAAMALEKIGYRSTIHACSLNHYFRELIPQRIHWLASVPDEGDDFHPHVILQYPGNVRIMENGIDFTTQRPNRVIFAHDPPSAALHIADSFAAELTNARVFLAASFNIIKDRAILEQRLQTAIRLIGNLPAGSVVLMEDACFTSRETQRLVAETLSPYLALFSMNEDELQSRYGKQIDILNPEQVVAAIRAVRASLDVPTLVCHSAYWALAYGKPQPELRRALLAGVCMASTRFRLGDSYNRQDYMQTMQMADRDVSVVFAREVEQLLPGTVCVPGKDMDRVVSPFTIGLGDAFIGGMLPEFLTAEQRRQALA